MLVSQLLVYRVEHIITVTILSINSLILLSQPIFAQVVSDGTLKTQVNLIDGQQKITGGIELGTNLFHSFEKFSPNTDVTHFDNNNHIQNIFTRVTGNAISSVNGLIKTNDGASLFILNPAGIIFGNNARLEIGGSFIATTAESIIFADGTKFDSQINQRQPLLTVSIPSGLQYGSNPGDISSNNTQAITLDVSSEDNILPGNTIALLGGNIDLQNISINSFSGNVEIGSIGARQIIKLSSVDNRWQFGYENVSKFNDIKISQNSQIETGGESGNINLQGNNIFLNPGLRIFNNTTTDVSAGKISLFATNNIDLNNIVVSTEVSGSSNPGQGSNIEISAENIKITNGSIISASTLDNRNGGNIIITGSESVELSGFNDFLASLILNIVNDEGAGGDIEINTGELVVSDGGRIDSSSFGQGKAGNIIVNADKSVFISGDFQSDLLLFNSGLLASSGFEDLPPELQIPDLGGSGQCNRKYT